MSLEYLLDTSVLSEPLRPQPARRVLEWIEEHRRKAATAVPVWHELLQLQPAASVGEAPDAGDVPG